MESSKQFTRVAAHVYNNIRGGLGGRPAGPRQRKNRRPCDFHPVARGVCPIEQLPCILLLTRTSFPARRGFPVGL